MVHFTVEEENLVCVYYKACLLYTSDAADD